MRVPFSPFMHANSLPSPSATTPHVLLATPPPSHQLPPSLPDLIELDESVIQTKRRTSPLTAGLLLCVAGAFAIAGSRMGSESSSRSKLNAATPSAHPHASSHLPLDEITASSWYDTCRRRRRCRRRRSLQRHLANPPRSLTVKLPTRHDLCTRPRRPATVHSIKF